METEDEKRSKKKAKEDITEEAAYFYKKLYCGQKENIE